ncbi:hypothetical protein EYF80_028600 [Liparis tanakae]|uniref:Uncharacterized protein n=1 Tax=Liparis tanakae TaxID=230148 RepID=A0A4Z2H7K4_9TELE|nr:hypothetical protein EYF80_028600 [Liparis tanakae]
MSSAARDFARPSRAVQEKLGDGDRVVGCLSSLASRWPTVLHSATPPLAATHWTLWPWKETTQTPLSCQYSSEVLIDRVISLCALDYVDARRSHGGPPHGRKNKSLGPRPLEAARRAVKLTAGNREPPSPWSSGPDSVLYFHTERMPLTCAEFPQSDRKLPIGCRGRSAPFGCACVLCYVATC